MVLQVDFEHGERVQVWVCPKCVAICVMGWCGVENDRPPEEIESVVEDLEGVSTHASAD